VIRGEDHISNTPRQILLYEALGFTTPAFAHLSLVMGPDHAPLSKRHGATSVAEFRTRDYLPAALVNYLALIGWSPGGGEELVPLDEMARRFSLAGVSHSAGVFDVEKLAWVNRHYLKLAQPARLVADAERHLREAGWLTIPTAADHSFLAGLLPLVAASLDRLDQLPARLRFLFDYSPARILESEAARAELDGAAPVVRALAEELAGTPPMIDRDRFRAMSTRVRERTGQKGKALFHPMRVVLTGEPEGLELDVAVPAIEQGALLAGGGTGLTPILGARARAATLAAALRP